MASVAQNRAGAIILNWKIKPRGETPGAEELLKLRMILLLALAMLMGVGKVCAQAPATEAQTPSPSVVFPARKNLTKERMQGHRFWDKKNDWLFASVGAARTFDYFSTLNLRRRGDREVLLTNEIVDNHAAAGPANNHHVMKSARPIQNESDDRLSCRQPRLNLYRIAMSGLGIPSPRAKRSQPPCLPARN